MAKPVHQSPANKISQGIGHGIKTNDETNSTHPSPQGRGVKRHDRNQEVGIQEADEGNEEVESGNTLRLGIVSARRQLHIVPVNQSLLPQGWLFSYLEPNQSMILLALAEVQLPASLVSVRRAAKMNYDFGIDFQPDFMLDYNDVCVTKVRRGVIRERNSV